MIKHLLTVMEEMRDEIKADHEELMAIMQAGHHGMIAKTEFSPPSWMSTKTRQEPRWTSA
jgi:hypothetical protein